MGQPLLRSVRGREGSGVPLQRSEGPGGAERVRLKVREGPGGSLRRSGGVGRAPRRSRSSGWSPEGLGGVERGWEGPS